MKRFGLCLDDKLSLSILTMTVPIMPCSCSANQWWPYTPAQLNYVWAPALRLRIFCRGHIYRHLSLSPTVHYMVIYVYPVYTIFAHQSLFITIHLTPLLHNQITAAKSFLTPASPWPWEHLSPNRWSQPCHYSISFKCLSLIYVPISNKKYSLNWCLQLWYLVK